MSHRLKRSLSLITGSALILDSIWLISLNKMHFGIVLPLVIGIGLSGYALYFQRIQRFVEKNSRRRILWRCLWGGFFLWLSSVLIFFLYLNHAIQQHATAQPTVAVIILGSGIENDQPSATLKQRLDIGAAYAQHYPKSVLVVSGGLSTGQKKSEAQVMADYLQQQYAIESSRILLESKSTSTQENLRNTRALLRAKQIDLSQPIAIATSDFHLLRSSAIAKHQGYQQIVALSAPTPLYIRYNSWLREYFAFISGWLLQEY